MTKDPLNRKQRTFVNEYIVDCNATQAAIRAGYSAKTAHVTGPRLLTNVRVAPEIDKALAKRKNRVVVTQDDVIRELAMIAFGDIEDYITWGPRGIILKAKDDRGTGRLVSKVSQTATGQMRLELHSKTQALEMLGRHLGMYTDRHELVSDSGITINLVEAKPPVKDSSGEES